VFRRREGNLGKRAIPQEPRVERGIPDPPESLSPAARTKWDELAPRLHAMGVLSKDDAHALQLGCEAFADWQQARKALDDAGSLTYVTVNQQGGEMLHARPEIQVRAESWKRFLSFLDRYGLTASSRAKIAPLGEGSGNAETDFA